MKLKIYIYEDGLFDLDKFCYEEEDDVKLIGLIETCGSIYQKAKKEMDRREKIDKEIREMLSKDINRFMNVIESIDYEQLSYEELSSLRNYFDDALYQCDEEIKRVNEEVWE
ncbi:hypothetical protein ACWOE5_01035 [Aerococcus sanguinicola]|uniref:Uncharacterized protein n=1 Tax=Aerococcus sanguinicola TaxID=119206 RepID=A0A120I8Z1_9LACT|nr:MULTISPECIES: hypothetical protein [Aerococcus]AMB93266.1 hypothetical protein AWM72_00020 [Aerococcus sanguinicola]OFT95899.1 hypothetical protein HMPREF3090_03505 [Aerococcus sp. HMSC23C02]